MSEMASGDLSAHRARREAYMKALGERGCAVVHSPPEALRNGDASYPFRQSSDLIYLTGFHEPETTLVLRPGASEDRVVLFVRPRDESKEIWDGKRAGLAGARERYGADAAYAADELPSKLPELIANCSELHYSLGIDTEFDATVCSTLARLRKLERRGLRAPEKVVDPSGLLHEMRLHKDDSELAILRRAAEITAEAHTLAMHKAAPGVFEYELEAALNYTFRRRGGSGPGYASIVGGGANATILHYIENSERLDDGDLVLIDAGCELEGYTADVTRTFPVSGTFSPAQRDIYQLVLEAQKRAVAMTRPGVTLDDIHQECVSILSAGMVELGLLEGPAQARIDDGGYKRYYMHRTSHWLGLDVHDVGTYTDRDGEPRALEPGMVITIEPGLYVAADDDSAPEKYRGIGVRIEDDVLVTEDGADNLTAAIPKDIDAVEAACTTA